MIKKKQIKNLLAGLEEGERSVSYANKNVTNTLLTKLKSTYPNDRTFFWIYLQLENENKSPDEKHTEKNEEVIIPIYIP